jgi:integrase
VAVSNRNGKWVVRVKPLPQVTLPRGATKATALKVELDLKLRLRLGESYEAQTVPLGEAIESYIRRRASTGMLKDRTVEYLDRSAAIWKPWRNVPLNRLRRAELEDFIAARADHHPASAKYELNFLKAVLRDAGSRNQRFDEAILKIPPIRHNPKDPVFLTPDEVNAIASWMPNHIRRAVLLAFQTGMRRGEILGLEQDDLDLENRILRVRSSKTKAGVRHVALTEEACRLLAEQLLQRMVGVALVFPHPSGRAHYGYEVVRWFKQAARATGRPDASFHSLRHSAVSWMAKAGWRLEHIGAQVGWAAANMPHMYSRYRHLYEGEVRERIASLDALNQGHETATSVRFGR